MYLTLAGKVVNLRFMLLINMKLGGQESDSNPLLRIYTNRWQCIHETVN
jgi:hypothetical protein